MLIRPSALTLALAVLAVCLAQSSTVNPHDPLSSSAVSTSLAPSATGSLKGSAVGANSTAPGLSTTASLTASAPIPTGSALNSTAANSTAPHLDTVVDPTFGILGSVLLISGLPLTVQGSRNRWTTYAITGIYAGALVLSLVILKVGVLEQIESSGALPSSSTRGLFLFASLVAGLFFGGCAVVWYVYCQHVVAAFAAFAAGLWILCLKSDGLFANTQPGFRYILVGGLAVVGFVLSTVPRLTTLGCLVGTAILGATATVIGIDCLTTQGLKEFYIINLGFGALFPKLEGSYPITLGIQIELACIPALAAVGTAVQMKFYKVLLRKARDLRQADRERNEEERAQGRDSSARIEGEMAEWESKHGPRSQPGSMPELKWTATESTLMGSSQLDFLPTIEDLGKAPHKPGTAAAANQLTSSSIAPQPASEFQRYLETRRVVVSHARKPSATQIAARKAVVSMPPRAHLVPATTPRPDQDTASSILSSDDIPLAEAAALARPASSLDFLSHTRPRPDSSASGPPKPVRPRPASLALPSESDPVVYQSAPSSTRKLDEVVRRSTLLDLAEEDDTPLSLRRRQSDTLERIVVHNWAAKPSKQPAGPPITGPRVMELDELQQKHRRSLAHIQHIAKAEHDAHEAKLRWERKLAREAEEQRAKEANRQAALYKLKKPENRRPSSGSINTLLRFAGAAGGTATAQRTMSPPRASTSRRDSGARQMPRRASAASNLASTRPEPIRRASSGNLLERQLQQRSSSMAEFGGGWRVARSSAHPAVGRSVQQARRETQSMYGLEHLQGWHAGQASLPPGAAAPVAGSYKR